MAGTGFKKYPKTPRLSSEVVITEKIDGTSSAVGIYRQDEVDVDSITPLTTVITIDGEIYTVWAQSRNRCLTLEHDNFGFAAWVEENSAQLAETLGRGLHYGEWFGKGIQRGYGLDDRHFWLFDGYRYAKMLATAYTRGHMPEELDVVPLLGQGEFSSERVDAVLAQLVVEGSQVGPGAGDAEGVIVRFKNGSVFKAYTHEASEKAVRAAQLEAVIGQANYVQGLAVNSPERGTVLTDETA